MGENYNGWTNYETWLVKLWLDNDEGSYRYWREVAENVWDSEEPDNRTSTLAKHLEEEISDNSNPLAGQANMYTDLLSGALSEVDWYEIANAFLEETEHVEVKEEE